MIIFPTQVLDEQRYYEQAALISPVGGLGSVGKDVLGVEVFLGATSDVNNTPINTMFKVIRDVPRGTAHKNET